MESRTTEKNTLIFRIVGSIFLVLGIIFLAVTLKLWLRGSIPGMMTADTGGSYCTLEPIGSERLGDTYEGAQAEDGYAFYRLDFQVTNEGDGIRLRRRIPQRVAASSTTARPRDSTRPAPRLKL